MKKVAAILLLLFATMCFARTRQWRAATVIGATETNVSGPLIRETSTMHYTVETEDMVLSLDYSYHPNTKEASPDQRGKNAPPSLSVNLPTKVAIEGRHAYILDSAGAEVKMHIVKKLNK
jgi:hypothetical protein